VRGKGGRRPRVCGPKKELITLPRKKKTKGKSGRRGTEVHEAHRRHQGRKGRRLILINFFWKKGGKEKKWGQKKEGNEGKETWDTRGFFFGLNERKRKQRCAVTELRGGARKREKGKGRKKTRKKG